MLALEFQPFLFRGSLEQLGQPRNVALEAVIAVDDPLEPGRLLRDLARLVGVVPEGGVV